VDPAPGPALFVLSARDDDRLRAYAERMLRWLDSADTVDLTAVSYTLQTGREEMAQRLAVVADDAAGLRDKLSRWLAGAGAVPGVWTGSGDRRGGVDLLLDGPEGGEYLRLVLAAGNLDKLARLWVGGASIDWSALWAGRAPRRIPLPSYPFAAQRFWIRPGPAFDELQVDGYGLAAAPAPAGPAGDPGEEPAQVEAVRTPTAPAPPAPSRAAETAGQDIETTLTQRVRALLAAHLGITPDGLRLDRSLSEYGVDSLGLRRLGRSLEAEFGIQIPGRFFATDDSVRRLTSRLLDGYGAQLAAVAADRVRPGPENLPLPGGGVDVPADASGVEVPPHASGVDMPPHPSGGEVPVPASGGEVPGPASGGDDVLAILVRGLRSGQVSVEQALTALNGRTAR
jgi:acyl carrier protein